MIKNSFDSGSFIQIFFHGQQQNALSNEFGRANEYANAGLQIIYAGYLPQNDRRETFWFVTIGQSGSLLQQSRRYRCASVCNSGGG